MESLVPFAITGVGILIFWLLFRGGWRRLLGQSRRTATQKAARSAVNPLPPPPQQLARPPKALTWWQHALLEDLVIQGPLVREQGEWRCGRVYAQRTVLSLERYGFITRTGDGAFNITPAGRDACEHLPVRDN